MFILVNRIIEGDSGSLYQTHIVPTILPLTKIKAVHEPFSTEFVANEDGYSEIELTEKLNGSDNWTVSNRTVDIYEQMKGLM